MNEHPRPVASRAARTPSRAFVVPLLGVLAALAVLSVAEARGATLDVTGPTGAEVLIDGSVRGVLPLPRPLTIEPGEIVLVVRRPGWVTHEEVVEVTSDDQQILIELDMIELSRWQAVGSSAVLAGLGQLYQSRPLTGWSMMALQLGAWTWLFYADDQYKSKRDEYLTALTEYENATVLDEVVEARAAAAAYEDLDSKNDMRTYATIAVVAVGVWSVYDVWRAHDGYHGGTTVESPLRTAVTRDGDTTHVEVGWRWTF